MAECLFCQKTLKSEKYLPEHLRIHTKEGWFWCSETAECKQGFPNKGNLDKHIKKVHKKLKFKCPVCKLKFKNASDVSRHRATGKKYQCIHCCHQFQKWAYVGKHCKKRHRKKEQPPKKPPKMASTENTNPEFETTTTSSEHPQSLLPHVAKTPIIAKTAGKGRKRGASTTPATTPSTPPTPALKNPRKNSFTSSTTTTPSTPTPGHEDDEQNFNPSGETVDESPTQEMEFVPASAVIPFERQDLFVIRNWIMKIANAQTLRENLEAIKQNRNIMMHILRGDWRNVTFEDFMHFLPNCRNDCGYFLTGVLLVDYLCNFKDPNDALDAYQKLYSQEDEGECRIQQLANETVLYLIKRHVRLEHPKTMFWATLPDAIQSKISLAFFTMIQNVSYTKTTCIPEVITFQEKQSLTNIHQHLLELLYESATFINTGSEETSASQLGKIAAFSGFLFKFMERIMNEREDINSVFDVLLANNLAHKIETTCKTIYTDEKKIINLIFHEQLVEQFGVEDHGKESSAMEVVSASLEDVETFHAILYSSDSTVWMETVRERLTFGVFEIAKVIKMKDIWRFLFRQNDIVSLITSLNACNFLQILYALDRKEEIQKVVPCLETLFTGPPLYRCLSKQKAEMLMDIVKLLRITNTEKYKILIAWAFDQDGRECKDPLKTKYYESVDEHFRKVKQVLPLEEMAFEFGQLCGGRYLKFTDWQMAQLAKIQSQI